MRHILTGIFESYFTVVQYKTEPRNIPIQAHLSSVLDYHVLQSHDSRSKPNTYAGISLRIIECNFNENNSGIIEHSRA